MSVLRICFRADNVLRVVPVLVTALTTPPPQVLLNTSAGCEQLAGEMRRSLEQAKTGRTSMQAILGKYSCPRDEGAGAGAQGFGEEDPEPPSVPGNDVDMQEDNDLRSTSVHAEPAWTRYQVNEPDVVLANTVERSATCRIRPETSSSEPTGAGDAGTAKLLTGLSRLINQKNNCEINNLPAETTTPAGSPRQNLAGIPTTQEETVRMQELFPGIPTSQEETARMQELFAGIPTSQEETARMQELFPGIPTTQEETARMQELFRALRYPLVDCDEMPADRLMAVLPGNNLPVGSDLVDVRSFRS